MSKTELALDVIGHRWDTAPVPMAYIMPSDRVLSEIIEPRVVKLMKSKALRAKRSGARQKKGQKVIGGVSLRLVPAGSASALSAASLGFVVTDEVDKFSANVKGQGAVIGLADRRGDAYADFVHFSTSSPSVGPIDVVFDEESGLYFWGDVEVDDLRSPIWQMWQSGARYHWSWPCVHCSTYFIPRFRNVHWDKPKDADGNDLPSTPIMAERTAHMICEECGGVLTDDDKDEMNARGVFVAPGQRVDSDGTVVGPDPDAWTLSYWVSGFASPFVPWGRRCAEYVEAARSGDINNVQTVVNGFGELFAPGDGDAPDWADLVQLRDETHFMGAVPDWVRLVTLTVDVQKRSLYCVLRGWGAAETSTLIQARELHGDTADQRVWDDLAGVLLDTYGGIPISLALIDSGYRPGKKFSVPDHMVYRFCRRFRKLAYATKGASREMMKPIASSMIDVTIDGKSFKRGLELKILDTGFFKRWLQFKLRWPEKTDGEWRLPQDVTDDYLTQMVSEVEISLPNGKTKWIQRSKQNHYFDCEAMQGAIAMMLNLRILRAGPPIARRAAKAHRRPSPPPPAADAARTTDPEAPSKSSAPPRRAKPRARAKESIW